MPSSPTREPSQAQGLWPDLVGYFLSRPPRPTRVPLETPAERENYDSRILQRLGISVADYSVLNIHQIGIEAPTTFVWDALTRWRPDGGYWPNTIARAVFAGNRPDHVEVSGEQVRLEREPRQ